MPSHYNTFNRIVRLLGSYQLSMNVGKVLPHSHFSKPHRLSEHRQAIGKIVPSMQVFPPYVLERHGVAVLNVAPDQILIIQHDFSKKFPELFTSDQLAIKMKKDNPVNRSYVENDNVTNWQDKYIQLLETYNETLTIRISPVKPVNSVPSRDSST